MVEVLHVILEAICVLITQIFCQIHVFFLKFLSQKLNLLYLEYFTDLQMQKTFEKHFQTIYYKFTTKLKKFIF